MKWGEGERERGRVQHQQCGSFTFLHNKNNIMWTYTRGLHTVYSKIKKLLPWLASDPSFVVLMM